MNQFRKCYIPSSGRKNGCLVSILGDLVSTPSNELFFRQKNWEELCGRALLEKLDEASITLINLEAPVTSRRNRHYKCGGPNLKSTPAVAHLLKRLPFVVISGANNHILDFGSEGLDDTLKILETNKIPYIGMGRNIVEARQSLLIETGKNRIGIYSCTQSEFSIAGENSPGANPYDPLVSFDDIAALKAQCDFCIILYHSGRENYEYPSVNQQKICRKMIEKGADIVVCQHSHCIGCMEQWNDRNIIYGHGNFIFDRYVNRLWDNSLLLQISPSCPSKIHYVLFGRTKNGCVALRDKQTTEKLTQFFFERSAKLVVPGFLMHKWEEFCLSPENLTELFLAGFMGIRNRYILGVDRRFGNIFVKLFFWNRDHQQLLLNFLRCETILENLKTVLKKGFH